MESKIAEPFSKVLEGVAASATGELTSDSIDFANGDHVVFTVIWGAMAGGAQTLEFDGSNDDAAWTSLKEEAGSSTALSIAVSTASASKMTRVEFTRANYRYLRVRVPRANAAALAAIISDQYNDRPEPATGDDVPVRVSYPFAPVFLPNGQRVSLSL